jgi:hypothetical protein
VEDNHRFVHVTSVTRDRPLFIIRKLKVHDQGLHQVVMAGGHGAPGALVFGH